MDFNCNSTQPATSWDNQLFMSQQDTFKFSLSHLSEDNQCIAYPNMPALESQWKINLRCVRNNLNKNVIGLCFNLSRIDLTDLQVQLELEVNMTSSGTNIFCHRCVANYVVRGQSQSSSFFMWISSPIFSDLENGNMNADVQVKLRDSFTTAIANPLSQTMECHSRMSLQADLSIFYQMQNWADITICASDGQSSAHKLILGARSPVFRRMLLEDPQTIHVPSMNKSELDVFLKYIYTGHFSENCVKTVISVYRAALEYEVVSLLYTCSRVLTSKIRLDSVCEILVLAEDSNDFSLKEAAVSFIRGNFSDVKNLKGFETLITENPKVNLTIQKALGIPNFSVDNNLTLGD